MRVHSHIADKVKLPCIGAPVAELAHHGSVAAVKDPDYAIPAVADQQVLLLRVMREGQGPGGSPPYRLRGHEDFLHELALLSEHLHSVGGAICDVDEPANRARTRAHK